MIILVVIMFFLHGVFGLEPAEEALIGAAILLPWSREAPEMILEKIEWPPPLFLRGLFIVVGALVESGVIASIAESMVGAVDNTGQAMIIVAWFAAVASAIVDNIPLTAAMIPLVRDISGQIWISIHCGGHCRLDACLGGTGPPSMPRRT